MADGQGAPLAQEVMVIGMTTKAIAGGVIGSAIGTVLGGGTWWERSLRGVVGMTTCYIGYHVVAKILVGLISIPIPAAYLPSVDEMEPAACLLCGMVGMVACQALVNAATAVRDRADDFVEHKLGGDDEGSK